MVVCYPTNSVLKYDCYSDVVLTNLSLAKSAVVFSVSRSFGRGRSSSTGTFEKNRSSSQLLGLSDWGGKGRFLTTSVTVLRSFNASDWRFGHNCVSRSKVLRSVRFVGYKEATNESDFWKGESICSAFCEAWLGDTQSRAKTSTLIRSWNLFVCGDHHKSVPQTTWRSMPLSLIFNVDTLVRW